MFRMHDAGPVGACTVLMFIHEKQYTGKRRARSCNQRTAVFDDSASIQLALVMHHLTTVHIGHSFQLIQLEMWHVLGIQCPVVFHPTGQLHYWTLGDRLCRSLSYMAQ